MGFGESTSPEIERVAREIVDAAYVVYMTLGPGLLESVYEICLAHELRKRGLRVERQVDLPVVYHGIRFDVGYRVDLIVEDLVFVEIKSVAQDHPIHALQCKTHIKLAGKELGFVINFNVAVFKEGIKRVVLSAR
jgi:GxxExxY protein